MDSFCSEVLYFWQMEDVKLQIQTIEAKIEGVEADIVTVSTQLAGVLEALARASGDARNELLEEKRRLSNEKDGLRQEKRDLRAKELLLLQEKARLGQQQAAGAMFRAHAPGALLYFSQEKLRLRKLLFVVTICAAFIFSPQHVFHSLKSMYSLALILLRHLCRCRRWFRLREICR